MMLLTSRIDVGRPLGSAVVVVMRGSLASQQHQQLAVMLTTGGEPGGHNLDN